uniref:ATP synthase CF0 A subunit n=1 Tax=Haramonas pauciplastida TaxID=478668 RepID=UPI0021156646|nr:ATP synthase CF0 A subunit [Haramonas pauciplastida]UTE95001.1 ATP synthase CF0 A subunit [Haramonas pauciplastida]
MILNNLNFLLLSNGVEVGKHYYWTLFGATLHGQVIIVSLIAIIGLIFFSVFATLNLSSLKFYETPKGFQFVAEYITRIALDISEGQFKEEEDFNNWYPFVTTLFFFIFANNLLGVVIPWKLIQLPEGELAAPTNDINTTVALALLTSLTYFYGGLRKKGLGYFRRYIEPIPVLLPINIIEDFTKPLSLSFRLFGNVLADELTVSVLILLAPLIVPLPIMALGAFAGSIQALIFSTLAANYIEEAIEKQH